MQIIITTSIKNPQANAILERIHAVFTNMLRIAKLDMAELVNASDIDIFLADAAREIFAPPTIQHEKPLQVQRYLDKIAV
jgi:hypothetical protein